MLSLGSASLIGKGRHRECFEHPANPGRCIKVVVAGHINENRREARYYAMLDRRGISWEMLTVFHGLVETNRGEGAVFDLVRDGNGAVSKTLRQYLENEVLSVQYGEAIRVAMPALRGYLLQHLIVTKTLKPANIVFQRTASGDGKLVVVDNVGNSDFVPLSKYSSTFARLKIVRKWRRFETDLHRQYPGNPCLDHSPGTAGHDR